jgi:hypothetical protein
MIRRASPGTALPVVQLSQPNVQPLAGEVDDDQLQFVEVLRGQFDEVVLASGDEPTGRRLPVLEDASTGRQVHYESITVHHGRDDGFPGERVVSPDDEDPDAFDVSASGGSAFRAGVRVKGAIGQLAAPSEEA